jgi:hypothetical protein
VALIREKSFLEDLTGHLVQCIRPEKQSCTALQRSFYHSRINDRISGLTGLAFLNFNQLHGFTMAYEFSAAGLAHEHHIATDIAPVHFTGFLDIDHTNLSSLSFFGLFHPMREKLL